jgi:hypothetical protein
MAQTDLTIAGVGGQGSILAGVILGSAAVTYDGKYATQTLTANMPPKPRPIPPNCEADLRPPGLSFPMNPLSSPG